jgi:transcriptional regulator with XRE-family HTH domain
VRFARSLFPHAARSRVAAVEAVDVPLSQRSFVDQVPDLLHDRGWSIRELARRASVSQPHLTNVLRGKKPVSGDLAGRVATVFGLPPEHFPEYRESFVIERIRSDSATRDRLYTRYRRS